ncbi:MAG: archaeosortase B [Methanosarcinaceae archaeon]|nr:archaeosortase B [Methanosarcinaceae archaeon]
MKTNKTNKKNKKNIKNESHPRSFYFQGFIDNTRDLKDFALRNADILKFAGSYLFFIGFFVFIYIIFQEHFSFLRNLTVSVLSSILGLLGVSHTLDETMLHLVGGISLNVIDECTGIYELFVYAGCVMAYPTSSNKKLEGIVFGIPAMFGINMVRLVSLAFVGLWFPSMFGYVHYYLWQVTLILLVVFVMLVWIEKIVKRGSK